MRPMEKLGIVSDRPSPRQPGSWQQELAEAVSDPMELLALLDLTASDLPPVIAEGLSAASRGFALRVPRSFVARMQRGNPQDPLLRQVLSSGEELLEVPGWGSDPLQESAARRAPGLLQKYAGRALLVTTGACAVHCRYCFRREFDYGPEPDAEGGARWSAALRTLADDPSIRELILSGGDPLALGNARLGALLQQVESLAQVHRVRFHTRTPIVLPSRVDAGLLDLLGPRRLQRVMVLHANHPAEIDADVASALRELQARGVLLLNQAVLLSGVNDSAEVLAELSERLAAAGVLPYYLFLVDRVRGAAHFDVSEERARQLAAELVARLPGFLVPRLVREVPGAASKTPIDLRQGDLAPP